VPRVREAILRLVRARAGESGIVYCLSRKSAESTAEFLRGSGVRAGVYHAGMEAAARAEVQEAFRRDEIDVVVATVAFGMGIDKPDVRYVIHRDMPRSIEGYYQEIGRAGRDGEPSDCVVFYSWADVMTYERFGESDDADQDVAERQRGQVREMFRLVSSRVCRHRAVTRYLGEQMSDCGASCDVCMAWDPLSLAPEARADRVGEREVRSREPVAGGRGDPVRVPDLDNELFTRLKALRREIADERHVPAYIVFSDQTLMHMAQRRPASARALLEIPGVGPKKLELYGERFLALTAGTP
jgi:ATP-dependent DNA helicase RecQ